jgi:hypothetical protein
MAVYKKLYKFVTGLIEDEMMKANDLFKAVLIFFILGIAACARIVAPTGGPKDEIPPRIVSSEPPNFSTNFTDQKIEIKFDEFIQLKEINQNLIVSPPMEEKPEVTVKGKTLQIEFFAELRDSTTYNIYMGNSVRDYNEGNPIENFQYVLSTGEYIDSMSVEGKVLNAFDLVPEEDVLVMLYSDLSDSIPMQNIPEYISKTDAEGSFRINNIRNERFKLFALRDANKNFLYDLPNEEIAFTDTLVEFTLDTRRVNDTLFIPDSLLADPGEMVTDSIWVSRREGAASDTSEATEDSLVVIRHKPIDTIITIQKSYYPVPVFYLMFFNEDRKSQYLANSKRDDPRKLELMFNKPLRDSVVIGLADTIVEPGWYLRETNPTRDTVFYWLTDTSLYKRDNIRATISYASEDSNQVYHWTTDTVNFRYFESGKKGEEEDSEPSLALSLNVKNKGTFDLNQRLGLTFGTPLQSVDTSRIRLFTREDTVEVAVAVHLSKDSLHIRKYHLENVFNENSSYRLEMYPGAFTDIYGTANDSVMVEFKTQPLDYYGKILANVTGMDSTVQAIVQLVVSAKDEEKVVREQVISADQLVEFAFLPPREFLLKVIEDLNGNGKWDTGNYLEHRQPEEVFYYKEPIKVRSNWDIEVSMPLKK